MELVEREPYLEELQAAVEDAKKGAGCLVLVSGEAGIGKTTLLEQFTNRHRRTTPVYWGSCDALFAPRPLGPLHDMAIQIGGTLADFLASDTPRSAVYSWVMGLLQRRPAIFVFEDVHWADEATFDLLRFIGRRINRTTALLIVSFRDDELGPRHMLRHVLGDLSSSSAARRIQLLPLSERAVEGMVGDQAVDAAALFHQTGGNPFYVTEVLANPTGEIPASVREAVLARAARLSASGYAVLEAAAIIGRRIQPWLLAIVTGAEAPAADECLAVGMLVAQHGELVFRHELARDMILEAISPLRKQVLHRMVLDALKSSALGRQDLARLAHHAEAVLDREAVLEFAPAAAKEASGAGAHREAAALYALALRFAADLDYQERALLLMSYADECNLIDQRLEGLEALQNALVLWQEQKNILKEGETLARITFLLNGLGRTEDAERACAQAIEKLEGQPPGRELALAYRTQSGLLMLSQNHHQAISWGEKAIALAKELGDTQLMLAASVPVGSAWLSVDYEYGCQYLEGMLETARKAGHEVVAAHIYANLSSLSSEFYLFAQAERYTREGVAYATEHGQERFLLYMLAWQAMTHTRLGRWPEALDLAEEILARSGVSVTTRTTALVARGIVMARQGDPRSAAVLDEALSLIGDMRSLHRIGLVRAARAEAAWLSGNKQATIKEAKIGFQLAVEKQHPWFAGELAFWLWRVGEAVEIEEWFARPFALQIDGDWRSAAALWEKLGCQYERARALAGGDPPAQIAALEIFERLRAQPEATRLREKLRAAGSVPRRPRASTRDNPFGLTNRQVEVLALLGENLTNAQIADRLHVSPKTVDHHVSAILGKLDVQTRYEAAEMARQLIDGQG